MSDVFYIEIILKYVNILALHIILYYLWICAATLIKYS